MGNGYSGRCVMDTAKLGWYWVARFDDVEASFFRRTLRNAFIIHSLSWLIVTHSEFKHYHASALSLSPVPLLAAPSCRADENRTGLDFFIFIFSGRTVGLFLIFHVPAAFIFIWKIVSLKVFKKLYKKNEIQMFERSKEMETMETNRTVARGDRVIILTLRLLILFMMTSLFLRLGLGKGKGRWMKERSRLASGPILYRGWSVRWEKRENVCLDKGHITRQRSKRSLTLLTGWRRKNGHIFASIACKRRREKSGCVCMVERLSWRRSIIYRR